MDNSLWNYPGALTPGGVDLVDYQVEARDGSIGTVDEATVDVDSAHLVVDTGKWIFGRKVVIPAGLVTEVDEAGHKVWVDLTKEQIKDSPEFDADRAIDSEYLGTLGTYYGPMGPAR
ncbi:MAG: hypothetical protein U0Q19_19000 [Kineosporiaceae bacterium]